MSGGGGGTTTQTVQNYSPEEVARRTALQDEARRIYQQQTAGGVPAFPGAPPIAPSLETLQAENYLRALVPGQVQNVATIQNATNFGLTDVLRPQSNPYYMAHQQAVINPLVQQYLDPSGVFAQIRQGAQEAGQFGGSRQGIAEGIAAGRFTQAAADALARMGSEAYGRGLDTFSRTLAFAPSALAAGAVPAHTLATVGGSVEGRAADQAAYEEARRLWELNAPWNQLQNYANIIYGGGSSGGTVTSRVPGPTAGQRILGAAGGALAGASLGSSAVGTSLASALGLSNPITMPLAILGAIAGSGLF